MNPMTPEQLTATQEHMAIVTLQLVEHTAKTMAMTEALMQRVFGRPTLEDARVLRAKADEKCRAHFGLPLDTIKRTITQIGDANQQLFTGGWPTPKPAGPVPAATNPYAPEIERLRASLKEQHLLANDREETIAEQAEDITRLKVEVEQLKAKAAKKKVPARPKKK